ncbi:hypothetical protein WJX75_000910 [Coccomyxa subellipsoidea]|uniref:DNA helicase n=1 Tax=Coccomyxa subellipsoidea TaxID=248742 RepID=A0ABR2YSX4_9CHLO
MRIIQRALKLLTPQCVFHDENKPLLPKLQPTPLPGVENGVRVDAGSLGLAASGVLLLQHHQLKKKEQDALAHTLEHSSKSVCADPALSVSVTAAVWMIADQKDIRQNCNSKKGRGMSSTSEKTHLSGNLLGAFDLVTSNSTADDMELEAIEHILDFSSEAGTDTDESSLEQMAALGRCMERHMAKAACMQQPTMSTGAANFLQQYFMALRQYDAADFGVTAGTLSSLARLAIASARLHLRDTVLALPDAVLAIIMFERSCDSKGFQSRMARDVQNIVPDGEELADHLRASHTALKAHFGSTDVGLAREE